MHSLLQRASEDALHRSAMKINIYLHRSSMKINIYNIHYVQKAQVPRTPKLK